ncbi:hypothetical protein L6452_40615 [Arctium lappa]|uniref:Uncharacterized protein n=1 Tax=Arctium lappa TaxID=4217 RepID=A0ACB8XNJ5_ARCLA|nr:hypothetical protein L6452_40615 [Arctium lappa]
MQETFGSLRCLPLEQKRKNSERGYGGGRRPRLEASGSRVITQRSVTPPTDDGQGSDNDLDQANRLADESDNSEVPSATSDTENVSNENDENSDTKTDVDEYSDNDDNDNDDGAETNADTHVETAQADEDSDNDENVDVLSLSMVMMPWKLMNRLMILSIQC